MTDALTTGQIHKPRQDVAAWDLARPLYDIRYDAYWLVERTRNNTYRFTGPIALGRVADVLPAMTEAERRHAMRHLPRDYTDAPYGVEVEITDDTVPE